MLGRQPSPFESPKFASDLPLYPHLVQLVRVPVAVGGPMK